MKKRWKVLCCALLAGSLCACGSAGNEGEDREVTLILDYVPNTNHTGIYVAQEKGYFEEEGITLNIVEPGNDQTSATLVGAGRGEFGVSYQEDVTYARTAEDPLPIRAIATVIKHNTSGFVSAASKDINSPADFEGKVYAGWQSPSEEAVIRACMTKAGADPDKITIVGDSGDGFASLEGDVDIKWFFEGWDNVKAEMAGFELNYMPLNEYDERLDYYTPVLIASEDVIENDPELVRSFLRAVKKGYQFAIDNPDESAEILSEYVPDYDIEFLKKSQAFLSANYTDDKENWGVMEDAVWDNYTDFMVEYGLIDEPIAASEQYTNEFITDLD